MNEIYVPYVKRYANFLDEENVGTTRHIIKTLRVISPQKAFLGESVSKYMRILDDMVDEETLLEQAKAALLEERSTLIKGKYTELQDTILGSALDSLSEDRSTSIKKYLYRIMGGQLTDINLRLTQIPLDDKTLMARHFTTCWSVLSAFSSGVFGIEPKPSKKTVKLMDAWGTYDSLVDLVADIENGLVLISKNNIEKYNLQFQEMNTVSTQDLRRYYNGRAAEARRDFLQYSASILDVGLPVWFAGISLVYFSTRSLKIRNNSQFSQPIIYRRPVT